MSEDTTEKGDPMHTNTARILRRLAIVLAVAAVAAPPASALRYGPGTPSQASVQRTVHMPRALCHQYCAYVDQHASQPSGQHPSAVQPRIVTITTDTGFNWGDAAVGFGAACGLALLALGTIPLLRHGHLRQTREPA
jgi:hypothetical protein